MKPNSISSSGRETSGEGEPKDARVDRAAHADRPLLLTVGHSTHTFPSFLELLRGQGVTAVADVRSQPFSRRAPQFNREVLAASLKEAGLHYVFLGEELGARRVEPECYEGGQVSFRRVVALPRFQEGLARLRQGLRRFRIALLCAEREPLDCHRTLLVCRELRGEMRIAHILADGTVEEQAATEQRLARQMQVAPSLFEPSLDAEEMTVQAYDRRAKQIAYRRPPAPVALEPSSADLGTCDPGADLES